MSDGEKLFNREAVVTVDTLQMKCGGVAGFDVAFEVQKDLTGKPNTCDVKIWNLSADHRSELAGKAAKKTTGGKPAGVLVRLDAGYKDQTSRIFEGQLRHLYSRREGSDVVTFVETGDGEYYVSRSKIFKAWGPGSPVETVLRDVARAIGIGDGNLVSAIRGAALTAYGSTFTQGTAVSGKAVKELNRLTRSVGLEWSIQDGTLQLLGTGKSLDAQAVLVSSDTGLVGSPDIDHKGVVSFKTLLIPDIFPGRKVKLQSEEIQGFFRVEKAKYQGDTYGPEWYIDCEAKRLT